MTLTKLSSLSLLGPRESDGGSFSVASVLDVDGWTFAFHLYTTGVGQSTCPRDV